MHQENPKICKTCSIMIYALQQWSGSQPIIPLRCVCAGNETTPVFAYMHLYSQPSGFLWYLCDSFRVSFEILHKLFIKRKGLSNTTFTKWLNYVIRDEWLPGHKDEDRGCNCARGTSCGDGAVLGCDADACDNTCTHTHM